jgi:hypothetical protein
MTDSTTQAGQKEGGKRRNRAFGCVVAGGVLFLIVVAAIAFGGVIYTSWLDRRIAELEQRIRDKGQPVTLEELAATYPEVPDEENAALDYTEALARYEKIDPNVDRTSRLMPRVRDADSEERLPEELRVQIADMVKELEPVFAQLDVAATKHRARFDIDFTQPADRLLPRLADMREFARLECLRQRLAVTNEDVVLASQCQRNTVAIAESLRTEPFDISQLVRASIHLMAADSLAYWLNHAEPPESVLHELATHYRNAEDPEALITAFVGERCTTTHYISDILHARESGPRRVGRRFFPLNYWLSNQSLNKVNRMRLLTAYEPLVELSDASWPERLEFWSKNTKPEPESEFSPSIDLVKTFIPMSYRCIPALAKRDAVLGMAQTALAIELYRSENGHLPDHLDALAPHYLPEVPEDPFDGLPLRYTKLEPGYRLYTVYEDRVDDGGVKAEKDESGDWHGDWIFEVRR